mmetsp:Transcript_39515/g.91499  ORF Transcript_39515/g.91499 Transcript_39515/m.91499 type:complete len:282 (-) Transcript_39515:820-1665(-)
MEARRDDKRRMSRAHRCLAVALLAWLAELAPDVAAMRAPVVTSRRLPVASRSSHVMSGGKGAKGFGAAPKRAAPAKKAEPAAPPADTALMDGAPASSRAAAAPVSYTGRTRKGVLGPTRTVPAHIPRPDYAASGTPGYRRPLVPWDIEVKSPAAIAGMRAACKLAREVLDAAGKAVAPGVRLDEIDRIVHEETIKRGAYPSTLNYCGYPKSVCTSVNEIVCHGIPDDNVLIEGDVVNIDVTCYFGGYHGDLSETFAVGTVNAEGKRLVRVAHEGWQRAISD